MVVVSYDIVSVMLHTTISGLDTQVILQTWEILTRGKYTPHNLINEVMTNNAMKVSKIQFSSYLTN